MKNQKVQFFFESYVKGSSNEFFVLEKSGSSRTNYFGRFGADKYIITYNENPTENEAFFYFSDVFSSLKLNTPRILSIDEVKNCYIQEYLGEQNLSQIIEDEGHSTRVRDLVEKSLKHLFLLQKNTYNKIDFKRCFEYEAYDELAVTNDLFYFKSFFVDVLEIPYHKSSILKEFKTLASKVGMLMPRGLMLRDFQSRNIMIDSDRISFIDYQSATQGPFMYDVVSFLFQAKANFPSQFKTQMLEFYIALWKDEVIESQLRNSLNHCLFIRFIQVLGAYGFRGLIQRKPHFISSIEKGIDNLILFSESWKEMRLYPNLKSLIENLNHPSIKDKIQFLISEK